jgi:hypothetical protein
LEIFAHQWIFWNELWLVNLHLDLDDQGPFNCRFYDFRAVEIATQNNCRPVIAWKKNEIPSLFFDSLSERCSRCGCFLSVKTYLKAEKCPVGKW